MVWLPEHNFHEIDSRGTPDKIPEVGFCDLDYWQLANQNSAFQFLDVGSFMDQIFAFLPTGLPRCMLVHASTLFI